MLSKLCYHFLLDSREPNVPYCLEIVKKYTDTMYARQCAYISLLKTIGCELCPLHACRPHCYASDFIRGEQEVFK